MECNRKILFFYSSMLGSAFVSTAPNYENFTASLNEAVCLHRTSEFIPISCIHTERKGKKLFWLVSFWRNRISTFECLLQFSIPWFMTSEIWQHQWYCAKLCKWSCCVQPEICKWNFLRTLNFRTIPISEFSKLFRHQGIHDFNKTTQINLPICLFDIELSEH